MKRSGGNKARTSRGGDGELGDLITQLDEASGDITKGWFFLTVETKGGQTF